MKNINLKNYPNIKRAFDYLSEDNYSLDDMPSLLLPNTPEILEKAEFTFSQFNDDQLEILIMGEENEYKDLPGIEAVLEKIDVEFLDSFLIEMFEGMY